MENRSFDHVLGHLSMAQYESRKDVDGLVDPATNFSYTNFLNSQGYLPFELKDGPLPHDLPHARPFVATQLSPTPGGSFTMSGFVEAYFEDTGSMVNDPPPMGFLSPADTPMSSFLATQYAFCDSWFAPLPADTQPNRSVAYSGWSLIDDTKARTIPVPAGSFIFDWLETHNVRWRVYHCGFSFFVLFDRFEDVLGPNFRSFTDLPADMQSESADEMPQVIFIEPEYGDSPVHFGWTVNDEHPPSPIGPGEHFLRDIYTALTQDPKKWNQTLLIVTHDEHGGFFDHVPPHAIPTPVPEGALYSAPFGSTGLRVPALIASPWVSPGAVFKGLMDHTSILQLLAEKFAGTPDYNDEVHRRRELGIQSVSKVLAQGPNQARDEIPPAPPDVITTAMLLPPAPSPSTPSQQAFTAAAQRLIAHAPDRAIAKFPGLAHLPKQ